MITDPTRRRRRTEAYGDWLGLIYRGLLYALILTPLWATLLVLAILWDRSGL